MCEMKKPRPSRPGAPLPFEAVTNFRELGGYEAAGGRHVKYGVFYRAPALANVKTPHDVSLYKSLGVHTVFDLRSAAERAAWPDPCFCLLYTSTLDATRARRFSRWCCQR